MECTAIKLLVYAMCLVTATVDFPKNARAGLYSLWLLILVLIASVSFTSAVFASGTMSEKNTYAQLEDVTFDEGDSVDSFLDSHKVFVEGDPLVVEDDSSKVLVRLEVDSAVQQSGNPRVYFPVPGQGIVPEELQDVYAQGSGLKPGEFKPGDWSYKNHRVRFNLIPSLVTSISDDPGLFSLSLVLEYEAESLLFIKTGAGEFFADADDLLFVRELDPIGGYRRIQIDVASSTGNIPLVDNEQPVFMVEFELAKSGSHEIRLANADLRTSLDEPVPQTVSLETELLPAIVHVFPGDFTTETGTGNRGRIGMDDFLKFSEAYFSEAGDAQYALRFDIGSYNVNSWADLPESDGRIDFRDLVIFSTGFSRSSEGVLLRMNESDDVQQLAWIEVNDPQPVDGGKIRIPILLRGEFSGVRAVGLRFKTSGAEFMGHSLSEVWEQASAFSASRMKENLLDWDTALLSGDVTHIEQEGLIGYLFFDAMPESLVITGADIRDYKGEPIYAETVSADYEYSVEHVVTAQLNANYPNPFNPTTIISYELFEAAEVRLTVHDALGRLVQELVSSQQPSGTHRVVFDATALPSGFYITRLQAGSSVFTNSMMLVK